MNPLFIKPGKGLDASFGTKKIYLKATAKDTSGAFSLMEYSLDPQKCGHALHYHETFDKTIIVLDGSLIIKINDKLVHAKKGDFVFIPRMAHHDFYNPERTATHFLMQFTPGGFEELLIALSKCKPEDFNDAEKIEAIRKDYDVVDLPGNWVEQAKKQQPELFR